MKRSMNCVIFVRKFFLCTICALTIVCKAQSEGIGFPTDLVEPFTAFTLDAGEIQLGTELNLGLSQGLMLGTDALSGLAGIPSFYVKKRIWEINEHIFSLSVQGVWLTLDLLANWSRARSHYKRLDARMLRAALIWSHRVSPRLRIHSYWNGAIGHIRAELSELGKRKSWEQKHPEGNYDSRDIDAGEVVSDAESSSEKNQEKVREESSSSNLSRRTLELQSLFGLSTDRFQMTGELLRDDGNKVLITTQIDKMQLEDLSADSLKLSISHQWHAASFHFRLGVGLMYLTIIGTDLDGEKVAATGEVHPVSDVGFYWRF